MTSSLAEATAAALRRLGASTLHEAAGGIGALDPALRPAWRGAAACGPAYPVQCHIGDNLPIHRALEHVRPGDVLVVQAGGHVAGYFGEVLAVAAQARGLAGLVIDGGVRDVDALEELRFPVFARGIGMAGTVKHTPGRIGEAIVVGGVLVGPGDVVVADADGVLCLPAARVPDALERGEARAAKEQEVMERLRAGALTLDLLGLRGGPEG